PARSQRPLSKAGRGARVPQCGARFAAGGPGKTSRENEPVPDSGGTVVRGPAGEGRGVRRRRPAPTGPAGLLGGEGQLRTRPGRGSDPMNTLTSVFGVL